MSLAEVQRLSTVTPRLQLQLFTCSPSETFLRMVGFIRLCLTCCWASGSLSETHTRALHRARARGSPRPVPVLSKTVAHPAPQLPLLVGSVTFLPLCSLPQADFTQ